MGMQPDAFYALTPAEFIYAWVGWIEHQESRIRQAWELERWSVWIQTCVQLDRKDRLPMTQMFPLPWESLPTDAGAELTMEERVERVKNLITENKNEENIIPGADPADNGIVQPPEAGTED